MIYYSVKRNLLQMGLVCKTIKATVETISKQLHRIRYYRPHSNANNIVLNLKWLCSLAP